MKKYVLTILIISSIYSSTTYGQVSNKIIDSLVQNLEYQYKNSDSPNQAVTVSNLMVNLINVFDPNAENKLGYITLRKAIIQKKFNNETGFFKWLMPILCKQFLIDYSKKNNDYIAKYEPLLNKIDKYICKCSDKEDYINNKNYSDCISSFSNDNELMNEYLTTLKSFNDNELKKFIIAMVLFNNYSCEIFFTKLTQFTATDLPKIIKEETEKYKSNLFEHIIAFVKRNSDDSLKLIYPTFNIKNKEIQAFNAIVKSNNNVRYSYEILVENNQFQRIKSYVVSLMPGRKIKLLGMAVYEINKDKPMFYINNMRYYPKQTLQNYSKIEKDLIKTYPKEELLN